MSRLATRITKVIIPDRPDATLVLGGEGIDVRTFSRDQVFDRVHAALVGFGIEDRVESAVRDAVGETFAQSDTELAESLVNGVLERLSLDNW